MSIKHFCDGCGAELPDRENFGQDNLTGVHTRRRRGGQVTPTRVVISVTADVEGSERPDLCRGCVIEAVKSLDTRPIELDDEDF